MQSVPYRIQLFSFCKNNFIADNRLGPNGLRVPQAPRILHVPSGVTCLRWGWRRQPHSPRSEGKGRNLRASCYFYTLLLGWGRRGGGGREKTDTRCNRPSSRKHADAEKEKSTRKQDRENFLDDLRAIDRFMQDKMLGLLILADPRRSPNEGGRGI